MRKITGIGLLFLGSLFTNKGFAQQDCYQAKKILCSASYTETDISMSAGNNENEISPQTPANAGGNSCIPNYEPDPNKPAVGELNSTWYTFIPQVDGKLLFQIQPVNPNGDFDWIIYDLGTTRRCDEIFNNHTQLVSKTDGSTKSVQEACNAVSTAGITGAVAAPGADNRLTDPITLVKGNTYVICVNRALASPQTTYTIDFSQTDPAIFDNKAPVSATAAINDVLCTESSFTVTFDEDVDCSNSFLNPSDFEIRDASGTNKIPNIAVSGVSVPACNVTPPAQGGKDVVLTITGAFPDKGQYSIVAVTGTDGNTIKDLCPTNYIAAGTIIAPINVVCADFDIAFGNCSITGTVGDSSGIAGNNFTYSYNFGDGSAAETTAEPSHPFPAPGNYNVTQTITKTSNSVTSSLTKSINVVVDNTCANMGFPTAFNPKGTVNKEFKVYPQGLIKDFEVRIFDRWGKMVYESNDFNQTWDGKVSGTEISAGIYVVISTYSFVADNGAQKYDYKGLLSVTP